MQKGNSKKTSFHSSFLLISYKPFVLCAHTVCWVLWVGHVTTELFVLQNRGCKVNEMPLTASVPLYSQPTMTLLSALVLRWDTGNGVCWRVRGCALSECTFVMATQKEPHIMWNKAVYNERALCCDV